ncbi:MAG: S46 family peptidase [Bacteroidales bacterium]|nr:S46 family peptidase [Bacteroidales bacterium]
MKRFATAIILAAMAAGFNARADEGMWMIHAIDQALEKKMQERGLQLSANELYNADAPGAGVSDAVVSLGFSCTGSIISDRGLLITNHHCAYSDIHALSTPEKNYLEDGFWAFKAEEEMPIEGRTAYFLKRVYDVTAEVNAIKKDLERQGKPSGMRRISHILETMYQKGTEMEASLSSMWKGKKYYMSLYEVYRDVRLVAAPPVSSAAFGGDIDNWEWPQHKCDFTMYRIYTSPDGRPAEYSPQNIPMVPAKKLDISLEGYTEGDFVMVIGYPGSTDRYSSSFETNFKEKVKHPITNRLRGDQMAIIREWMDKDPEIRLKYSDYYFSLSNMQEYFQGEEDCFRRFDVVEEKGEIEKGLQEWIDGSPARQKQWGGMLTDLQTKYTAVEKPEADINYFRECIIRGTRLYRVCSKVTAFRNGILTVRGMKPKRKVELTDGPDPAEEEVCRTFRFRGNAKALKKLSDALLAEYDVFDTRVEKDLLRYALEEYAENLDTSLLGPYQKEMLKKHLVQDRRGGGSRTDYNALTEDLWNSSFLSDKSRVEAYLAEEHTVNDYLSDPLYRFFTDVNVIPFNTAIQQAEGDVTINDLDREYTHALYEYNISKGQSVYPDANSTMRLTYGTVCTLEPRDGIVCGWKTTPAGILHKHNPDDYDFSLNQRQQDLYSSGDWGRWGFGEGGNSMYVNFLTDIDITGGNSGSPVMNSKGELIGLAFDGNKESLASDAWYTPGYSKGVCVDIRFILWTLDRYAGMTRIIEELGLDSSAE